MINLPKKYKHFDAEKKWQNFWSENKIYKWEKDLPRDQTFVIDTPPPTVSGVLHMGHVFSYVQADFIARYQRMKGKTVFYPMGFDDNGLPTERLVEKVKKIRGVDMDRADFVKECQSVVDEAEEQFEELFNSVALSVDWDEKYQTISAQSQKISQLSFIDLFNKGLVERKMEPVLWDIVDRTALSQADLVDKEKPSAMHYIKFSILDNDQEITIATTRPELLSACGAVIVNPEDDRYKDLIGKKAITPLFGVKVDIIADEMAQIDKGTGAVMCCTFGDETDILWWKKYNLPLRLILCKDGKITNPDLTNLDIIEFESGQLDKNNVINLVDTKQYFTQIAGLSYKEARKITISLIEQKNLLVKSEDITHNTKCAERSGVPIEILVVPQWFIKILDIKEQLKEKAAECNWYPHFMKVRIDQWIDGISWDWCISRQRFFGVPFPIWYSKKKGEEGKILVADTNQLPCDPLKALPKGYKAEEIVAETDIMDTWATSSVSPQLSSHGITENLTSNGDIERHKKLFPADLRPQAHEIIRSWAFYTIVKAYLHEETIPWHNLMISGWCLASDKTKMSKSKGNVVTPNALITEKGSDVVRYWASTSHLGCDTAYSEDVLKIGGKLLNKLFNAAKFTCTNFESLQYQPKTVNLDIKENLIFKKSDLWILSKLHKIIAKSEAEFEKFEYAKAREAVEDFFWNDFCDNYLEIAKVRAYGIKAQKYENIDLTDEERTNIIKAQQSALITLYHCLETLLRLLAPFIPHLCEELFQAIFNQDNTSLSINSRGSWPNLEDHYKNDELANNAKSMLEVISHIRKFKSDNNISLRTQLKSFQIHSNSNFDGFLEDLRDVTNAKEIILNQNKDGQVKINSIELL
jgi:valyl-tRNA synthetase